MERSYFENYCGGGPYAENYRLYSGIEHCLYIVDRFRLPIRSVRVLGAATGEVLRDFERELGVCPEGCELSHWAHARIPDRYRDRIARADMRTYVPACVRRGEHSDLLFSNALVYLDAPEVPDLLGQCRALCHYFHFLTSTSECFEPGDRHRVTLRPRRWWRARFVEAGFVPTRSPYLFRAEAA